MKKINTILFISFLIFAFGFSSNVLAATPPNLGLAGSFSILSNTYTNTTGGTTINGSLGYTTGPAIAPTVNGVIYTPSLPPLSTVYADSGIAQGSALANLNSQPCTFTFPAGAVDLATDTTHGPVGVYTPGVYCTTASSAASIGAGGIRLNGAGTYIFRINGALTTVANSSVVVSNGASSCDIWWTPTAATTLGANSNFLGTDISNAGITIGNSVTWVGRALAFAGTITTDSDTITSGTCQTSAIIPTSTIAPISTIVPKLPNTGIDSSNNISWPFVSLAGLIMAILTSVSVKKTA